MATYRVKMNNTVSSGENFDPAAPKGISFHHILGDSLAGAIQAAEQQFAGKCESAAFKKLTPKTFLVDDMEYYENYEILADAEFTNDTLIFRKTDNIITVTLRGGEFSEKGQSYWFDLSIIEYIKYLDAFGNGNALTLGDLEAASAEIYTIVMEKEIPGIFSGKMNRVKV